MQIKRGQRLHSMGHFFDAAVDFEVEITDDYIAFGDHSNRRGCSHNQSSAGKVIHPRIASIDGNSIDPPFGADESAGAATSTSTDDT